MKFNSNMKSDTNMKSISIDLNKFLVWYRNPKIILKFLCHKVEKIDSFLNSTKLELNSVRIRLKGELKNVQLSNKLKKKEKEPRHYAPASKEWKNSIYYFNKNAILDLTNKDKTAALYIKSYFNMVSIPSIITKSKRMRDLIRRSSTKQLFVSNPEIKQTNDIATITAYTFDREKSFFYRKLFFLRKWLNENLMGKNLRFRKNINKNKNSLVSKLKIVKLLKKSIMYKKHIIYKKKLSIRDKKNVIKNKLSKYNVKDDLFKKTINVILKKRKYMENIFFYLVMKSILSYFFNKKIYFIPKKKYKNLNKNKRVYSHFAIRKNKKDIILTKEGKIKHIKPKQFKIFKIKDLNLKSLRMINILLFKFILSYKKNFSIYKYTLVFNKLKTKYEKILKRKFLKKEVLIIKYLSNLYLNKFKYYSFLPGLKSILTKIYNKKIKLNLVNLKNVHLNSDIFSEAVSIKLRNRTAGLLRILRKSFNFVKSIKPNNKYIMIHKYKNFPAKEINTYFGKYVYS